MCMQRWPKTALAAIDQLVIIIEASCHQLCHLTCSNLILLKWHHQSGAWGRKIGMNRNSVCLPHLAQDAVVNTQHWCQDHISVGFPWVEKTLGNSTSGEHPLRYWTLKINHSRGPFGSAIFLCSSSLRIHAGQWTCTAWGHWEPKWAPGEMCGELTPGKQWREEIGSMAQVCFLTSQEATLLKTRIQNKNFRDI